MKQTTLQMLGIALAAALFASSPAAAQSIELRWNAPSRLTPDQASDVLYRQASGQAVSASDLFEAEKYLRTDGALSVGATVMKGMVQKLIGARLAGSADPIRLRTLDPVIQWAESSSFVDSTGTQTVRLRGEGLIPAVLNEDPNLAAVELFHYTLYKDWKLCGQTPCFTAVSGAVRTDIAYELGIPLEVTVPGEARSSELLLATGFTGQVYTQTYPAADQSRILGVACDPLPSQAAFTPDSVTPSMMLFLHSAQRTENQKNNQLLYGFFAQPSNRLSRISYFAGGALAVAPPGASRSATVNNPLDFLLFP